MAFHAVSTQDLLPKGMKPKDGRPYIYIFSITNYQVGNVYIPMVKVELGKALAGIILKGRGQKFVENILEGENHMKVVR